MTIEELIEKLTEMVEEEGLPGETEVHFVYQSNYPLVSELKGVTTKNFVQNDDENEDGEASDLRQADVVYLVEGAQVGYGPKHAWNCV